jgi:hypothetical protein
MHCIQYIATTAEDRDEAFRRVKHNLEAKLGNDPESETNSWYDWFVTGGGRWAKKEEAQYDDNYQDEVAEFGTTLFAEYLDKANEFRNDEFSSLIAEAKKVSLTELLDTLTPNEFRGGMELYPFKKIYDMTMGVWDFNSYFYDMDNDSTNMIYMQQAIDKGIKNWYLVPVDFHF